MLLSAHSDDSDMLWLISSDNFPFRSLVSESHVSNILLLTSFVNRAKLAFVVKARHGNGNVYIKGHEI